MELEESNRISQIQIQLQIVEEKVKSYKRRQQPMTEDLQLGGSR